MQARLADLSRDEVTDLFLTATRVQRTLRRVYHAEAFNIAVQDGEAAGQSVPHVHCHVIPRSSGDPAAGTDKVHDWLEGEEGNVGKHQSEVLGKGKDNGKKREEWVKDEDREPRGMEEMKREAEWLRAEMAKDEEDARL